MVIAVRTERGAAGLEVVKQADTETDRLRLQSEASWLARAAHPGVVDVIAATPTSLRLRHAGTALARIGPLAPDHAAAVVRNLASTVGDLHQLGVAHGRVDADHVLIDAHGRPRLCGFAEARDASDSTRADDVAALGRLLDDAIAPADGVLWSPSLRGLRAAGRRKRAMQSFRSAASAARAEPPSRRPTARQLAAAIREALPELTLPATDAGADEAPSSHQRSARLPAATGFAEIPADIDPTGDMAWSDHDLAFLALEHEERDEFAISGESGDHQQDPAVRPLEPRPLESITIRPPSETAPRPGPDRRLVAVVAAIVLVAGIVAGSAIARALRPFGGDVEPTASRSTSETSEPASRPSADATATTVALTPPPLPAGCQAHAARGPDVDGDGCPDAVTLDGRIAQVGSVRVELGADGDLVTLGDPDCDGVSTPALLRPSTGEVFVFDEWNLSDPTEVEAVTVVPGGESIASSGPCSPFVVTGPGGSRTQISEATS